MISISRRPPGVTLMEVLITGTMFGLFTGMVAGAMKMAHQSQESSVAKIELVRRASVTLDQLVRDLESARFSSSALINGSEVPIEPISPEGLNELQIRRFRDDPTTPGEDAEAVKVGYWFVPPSSSNSGEIRRTIYQAHSVPLQPVPEESADGRVLARGVKKFHLWRQVEGDITYLKANIWVGSLAHPISTAIAMERTAL